MTTTRQIFRTPYQLRRGYQRYDRDDRLDRAHDLFQRRMEPANFHPRYLLRVAEELSALLDDFPDDEKLKFELAFTLLQNGPSADAVDRAADLLAEVGSPTVFDDGDVDRLRVLAGSMRAKLHEDLPGAGVRFVAKKISWSVNNECPMICRGCNNPFVADQVDRDEAMLIADKIIDHGTTHIALSGGDPLLWPHIFDVIDRFHDAGVKVALDTTGYTLDRSVLDRVAGKLALLRLPLDGSNPRIEHFFRRSPDKQLHAKLLGSLQLCDEYGLDRVTVHTAVSKGNIDDLPEIAKLIAGHRCVHEWVLLQWWGRRAPRKLVEEMLVDSDVIAAKVEEVRRAHPDLPLFYGPSDARVLINYFVQSSGQVVTFAAGYCEEFIVGNMLTDEVSDVLTAAAVDLSAIARASAGGLSDL